MWTGCCWRVAFRPRSSTTSSSRLASSALVLLALLVAAPAAQAQGQAGARAAVIAEALREDPLYVSDSMARVATPEAIARLRAAMRDFGRPVFVMWTPYFNDEPGLRTASDLVAQVHDQLGRDGLYLQIDPDGIGDEAEVFGRVPLTMRPVQGQLATSDDVPYVEGAVVRAEYLLRLLATGERPRRGDGEAFDDRDETATRYSWITFGVVTGLTWLLLVAWRVRRGRGRRTARGPKRPAVSHAQAAREAVDDLATRLDGRADPPERAVDALGASRRALDGRHDVDEAGALVLARLGRAALDGHEDRRPCFVNPLHPWSATTIRYTLDGQTLPVPTCKDCARRIRHGAPLEPLEDRGKPYWERDTSWARTGFGALDPDLTHDLLAGRR